MTKSLEIAVAAAFAAIAIVAGHWFPWPALLHRELHRLEAYIYGVLAILGPACVVLGLQGEWATMALLGACTLSAGITTMLAKTVDLVAGWRNELLDRRARDAQGRPDAAHDRKG